MSAAGPVTAFVGLGANLGEAAETLRLALAALGGLPECRLLAASSVYRTAPVDASGPDYLNGVARLETSLAAEALLDELLALELRFGRERRYHHAPRTLDLDLLLHGEQIINTPRLTLPHPRAHQRAFVLVPLSELAPDLVLPGRGAITDWLGTVQDQAIERLAA